MLVSYDTLLHDTVSYYNTIWNWMIWCRICIVWNNIILCDTIRYRKILLSYDSISLVYDAVSYHNTYEIVLYDIVLCYMISTNI